MGSGSRRIGPTAVQLSRDEKRRRGTGGGLRRRRRSRASARRRRPRRRRRRRRAAEAATRAWFPETFLFEPLVVTDDTRRRDRAGARARSADDVARARARALARGRAGRRGDQLPRHAADLRRSGRAAVPGRRRRDQAADPDRQHDRQRGRPARSSSRSRARPLRGGGGARTIPAQGSLVEYATLHRAAGGHDRAPRRRSATPTPCVRTIEVAPGGHARDGHPQRHARRAAHARRSRARRAPIPRPTACACCVYPGRARAAALRARRVDVARGGVADDAYALLLAGSADGAARRARRQAPIPRRSATLSIVDRPARDPPRPHARCRSRDAAHRGRARAPAQPGARAARRARRGATSRSTSGPTARSPAATGWTLQRVLVATAEATRAVASADRTTTERAARARRRRSGARARSSATSSRSRTATPPRRSSRAARSKGALAETLRARVRAAIKDDADGAQVPRRRRRAWCAPMARSRPRVEATALAVLALDGDPDAPLADLGDHAARRLQPRARLGRWPREPRAACRRCSQLFKTPVPEGVKITLADGRQAGRPRARSIARRCARCSRSRRAAPAGFAGAHEWKIVAEPAVPGPRLLARAARLGAVGEADHAGGARDDAGPGGGHRSGRQARSRSRSPRSRPRASRSTSVQSLPAGVQVDTPSLRGARQRRDAHLVRGRRGQARVDDPGAVAGPDVHREVQGDPDARGLAAQRGLVDPGPARPGSTCRRARGRSVRSV